MKKLCENCQKLPPTCVYRNKYLRIVHYCMACVMEDAIAVHLNNIDNPLLIPYEI